MNLAFLLPAGLAALAAVLLPLLIHLARRSEQRPTVFAALQWLRQKPKPRHRIRLTIQLKEQLRMSGSNQLRIQNLVAGHTRIRPIVKARQIAQSIDTLLRSS